MCARAADSVDRRAEFSIRADIADFRLASSWLTRACADHGVPEAQVMRLDVCLDEALANVVAHGDAAARGEAIRLVFMARHDKSQCEASVTVMDSGPAFDPLAVQPRKRPTSLLDAEPGGLGLTMMRSFSDKLIYRHHAGSNQLTFIVRWQVQE